MTSSKTWAEIAVSSPHDKKKPSDWFVVAKKPIVVSRPAAKESPPSPPSQQPPLSSVAFEDKVEWLDQQFLREAIRNMPSIANILGSDDEGDQYAPMFSAFNKKWRPTYSLIVSILEKAGNEQMSETQLVDAIDAELGFAPSSREQVRDYYRRKQKKRGNRKK